MYLPSSSDYLSQRSESQLFRHLTNDELQKEKHTTVDRPVSQGRGSMQNTECGEWHLLVSSSVRNTSLDILAAFVLGRKQVS